MKNWKAELKTMMLDGRWSEAVVLMQNIIKNTPDNPDAYLNMVYLLEVILVEERSLGTIDCEPMFYDECEALAVETFQAGCAKFKNDPSYMFFMGFITTWCEWLYGMEETAADNMMQEALRLDPLNKIYLWSSIGGRHYSNESDQEEAIYDYTKMLLSDAELVKEVRDRGPIGDYYIEGMDSAMKNAQLYFDLNGSVKK